MTLLPQLAWFSLNRVFPGLWEEITLKALLLCPPSPPPADLEADKAKCSVHDWLSGFNVSAAVVTATPHCDSTPWTPALSPAAHQGEGGRGLGRLHPHSLRHVACN